MSLSESVVQIIEEQAEAQSFRRVKRIWLEIGALSDVEPDAMLFCMEAVTKGSVADGAAVEILRTPGTAWCMDCRDAVAVQTRFDPCPDCGGFQVQVTGGNEMRIKQLEVE